MVDDKNRMASVKAAVARGDFDQAMALLRRAARPSDPFGSCGLRVGIPWRDRCNHPREYRFISDNGVRFYSLKEFYYMPHGGS